MPKKYHTIIPACYLLPMKDEKILLLRRYGTGYEDGNYSLVAGHVDPGESFSQTMVREAQEEAGITVLPHHLEVAHVLHRFKPEDREERVDVFMMTKTWEGEIRNMEPHKCDDLRWFAMDRLPDNTIPYIRRVLEDIQRGIMYGEYGW